MPSLWLKLNEHTRYSNAQLLQLRRQMLRYARSLRPGPEPNERRQIAASLRSLFRDKRWLDAHIVEGQQMLDKQNQCPQCTACGSPMKLTAIDPGARGQDLRTFTCPSCNRVEPHIIESAVTAAWLAAKS
jgi:hypothetical protein